MNAVGAQAAMPLRAEVDGLMPARPEAPRRYFFAAAIIFAASALKPPVPASTPAS